MFSLHEIENTYHKKTPKRVGRGKGSKLGKTCGRGSKGMGARSGYQRRWGYEGGQMRLHMKLPKRGFSNARFQKEIDSINLGMINEFYQDGEHVSPETLKAKGLVTGRAHFLKILAEGEIDKKVKISAHRYSASAKEKLEKANIQYESI
jgi:large subunit ribosomal protein L15